MIELLILYLPLIADLCGVCGTGFFLKAEFIQCRKIYKTKRTDGISLTHYKDKIKALIFTMIAFGITGLWFSFMVLVCQFIIASYAIHLIKKYRPNLNENDYENHMMHLITLEDWRDSMKIAKKCNELNLPFTIDEHPTMEGKYTIYWVDKKEE